MTVKQAQCLLLYLGYSPGWPDDVAGEKTSGAASAFQADYGLPVTGKLDETTCKLLIAAVAGTAAKVERPVIILPLVISWYILTELGSVLEKAVKMCAPVPG